MTKTIYPPETLKYLRLLSTRYPTPSALFPEIINRKAVLHLPKGTEHFISDLHGEYESVEHILRNCSGVIREKVRLLYGDALTHEERSRLCTLIYYPKEKLKRLHKQGVTDADWYRQTLGQLVDLARLLSSKYTRTRVRERLPADFAYIIDELLHAQTDEGNNQHRYHENILESLIQIGAGDAFVCALCDLIRTLAVETLHVVGDIFDRGPRPDSILDLLMKHHDVDFEWGNHDILWMGAASGSESCIAGVVRNSIAYGNMQVLESGYGISLRPLTVFAEEMYPALTPEAAATQAISVMMFKLEGQLIRRHPEYEMEDHLLLHHIDHQAHTVAIEGQVYPLAATFPTLNPEDPYALTEGESDVLNQLVTAFADSKRLHQHIGYLYQKGAIYKRFNGNLLFHGCIPMDEDGSFHTLVVDGEAVSGRGLMNAADRLARRAYHQHDQTAQDFVWYLWCGAFSPLCGRKTTPFAHIYLTDPAAKHEPRNPYYVFSHRAETCFHILEAFDLPATGHIINGHTPIRAAEGESPVKANGKLFVIDGGFCRAIQKTTGIAGYTLISNSHGLRIMRHEPFTSIEAALESNSDIRSLPQEVETYPRRLMVADTDMGRRLQEEIGDLEKLLDVYRAGVL